MKTILNNCLCARLETPAFVDALDRLARIIGGWAYMKTCCQGQVACRIIDPLYMAAIEHLFTLHQSVNDRRVHKPLLRTIFLGKNPFASRLIAARAAFNALPTRASKIELMMSMRAGGGEKYKVKKARALALGWEESAKMSL